MFVRLLTNVAGCPLPAGRALAGEGVSQVAALAAVAARGAVAVRVAQRARLALPAIAARAPEVRHAVRAGPVVAAGVGLAVIAVCSGAGRTYETSNLVLVANGTLATRVQKPPRLP